MRNYDTLSEAINDLISEGYTYDFNLNPDCIKCASLKIEIHPEDFEVDAFYRFEGMSSTDDNSILYAISSKEGIKGLLVDAYGMYSESLNEEMIQKLTIKH
ncbi:phosphoribosylpyrophosphate synthetase [Flavobacterium sp.]|uniref:phosphoribosylpyrophosphate synthetase n=1 Tax=Flavobacterium sp. TaxID=239 RepID=UPI004048C61A